MKTITEEELFEILDEDHHGTVLRWLDRGDGVAIYQNVAMDSADFGHRKFVSYGSKEAQLEVDYSGIPDGVPPMSLPDIGNQINWRYQLEAAVRRKT